MSYLNKAIDCLGDISSQLNAELLALREEDKIAHEQMLALAKAESDLLESLRQVSKQGPDFDEEPLKIEYHSILKQRQALQAILDRHMKLSQSIYDNLDRKIAIFDSSTKDIAHLLPSGEDAMESGRKKKKKKTADETEAEIREAFEVAINSLPYDPTEPLYCICRRPSYSHMIACDNADCKVEWFHYPCVGIVTPPEKWVCAACVGLKAKLESGKE